MAALGNGRNCGHAHPCGHGNQVHGIQGVTSSQIPLVQGTKTDHIWMVNFIQITYKCLQQDSMQNNPERDSYWNTLWIRQIQTHIWDELAITEKVAYFDHTYTTELKYNCIPRIKYLCFV